MYLVRHHHPIPDTQSPPQAQLCSSSLAPARWSRQATNPTSTLVQPLFQEAIFSLNSLMKAYSSLFYKKNLPTSPFLPIAGHHHFRHHLLFLPFSWPGSRWHAFASELHRRSHEPQHRQPDTRGACCAGQRCGLCSCSACACTHTNTHTHIHKHTRALNNMEGKSFRKDKTGLFLAKGLVVSHKDDVFKVSLSP